MPPQKKLDPANSMAILPAAQMTRNLSVGAWRMPANTTAGSAEDQQSAWRKHPHEDRREESTLERSQAL
jgi:hypothetical protein